MGHLEQFPPANNDDGVASDYEAEVEHGQGTGDIGHNVHNQDNGEGEEGKGEGGRGKEGEDEEGGGEEGKDKEGGDEDGEGKGDEDADPGESSDEDAGNTY